MFDFLKKIKTATARRVPSTEITGEIITRGELTKEEHDRFKRINREFRDGLELIKKYPKSVTIFGSARFTEDDPYYQKARSIARKISCEGYAVVTGAGGGIMEAGNRGAYESNCKGKSVGFNIQLPYEQKLNDYTDDNLSFYYFFSRKVSLAFSAEVYIFLPGGFGTLDEFFEILTLVQTKKIEKVPIILVGKDYWSKLDSYIEEVLDKTYRAIDPEDRDLYVITEDEEEMLEIIRNAPLREE